MTLIPVWSTISGTIGTVQEGNSFSYSLQYTNSPSSVSIIAGSLPTGLMMDSVGNISGTAAYEMQTTNFSFTVRLQNSTGIADRTFSITVANITPIFTSPSNLGTYQNFSQYSFNLSVFDPGGGAQSFELLGILPTGLNFNSFGKIYGTFDQTPTIVSQTYTFNVACFLDGGILEQSFSITVVASGSSTAEVVPVWLTPSGSLGGISTDVPFSVQVIAKASDGLSTITYTASSLPLGFSINSSTGIISGTLTNAISQIYVFTVTASVGISSTTQIFSLDANQAIVFPITVLSPSTLGTLQVGQSSNLQILATSGAQWNRYIIIAGNLPTGLALDIVTGEIQGTVQVQPTGTFSFTVQIYNDNYFVNQVFTIVLTAGVISGSTVAYTTVYGFNKIQWIDLLTEPSLFIGKVYREGDPNYGHQYQATILLTPNLNNPSQTAVFNTLYGERRTYLNLGSVQVAQFVQNGSAVYDVLYRKIYDDDQGADLSITNPVDPSITVRPGSLANLRTKLLTLGLSGSTELLPQWMTCAQTNGTILGWFPAMVFIYLQPNTGQIIANQINEQEVPLQKLYATRIRIDRLICAPSADTSFQPFNILYDNVY